MVKNEHIEGTDVDSICRQLGFIFDLNYDYSINYYKNNLLNNKIELLKTNIEDKRIEEIENIILEYIEKRT